jgi:membrane fusion protein (multidrug efflux system)
MGYGGPVETGGAIRPLDPETELAGRRARWRHRLLFGFVVLLILGVSAYGVHWFNNNIRYVSTDDAYVDAQLADVAPEIDGTIAHVAVIDTQNVRRGDLLLRLDPADATLALDQALANYDQALRHVQQYTANVSGAQANVAGREADVARATLEYNRRSGLVESGAVSREELSTVGNALDNARSALSMARQALAAQQVQVAESDASQNPEVRAAKAALDHARLTLARTELRAPVDGIVAQSHAQIGQRVHAGLPLMTVVPVRQAYVNANFKEVQLDRIRPGQTVTLISDLYGTGTVFHGRVAGVSGGTGAAFAVIPAQNATGNWIKVVQRLPVRIALDPKELARKPLRVGLSMSVTVDLDPFAAAAPKKPHALKPWPKPAPKIALGDFVIDPLPAIATPPAPKPEPGAQLPGLRTVVNY